MMHLIYVTLALLLHSSQGLAPDYSTDRVLASQEVRDGSPPSTLQEMQTQPNIARLMRVFPSESWDALFPNANEGAGPDGTPYNYFNLVSAAWKFPRFCGEPGETDAECLHELVTMFAHFIRETGGDEGVEDGLYWLREIGCYSESNPHGGSCDGYCSQSGVWGVYPCGNRAYYGRGAKQLSWNYNYAMFSKKMTGTADTYLLEPDRIITDGWPALASAIWFWMTPQLPKPSMHEVTTGLWAPNAADTAAGIIAGFGTTTNIINGGIECGKSTETQQSTWRILYYRTLCEKLGASCFATHDSCASPMHSQFPASGTAGSGPLFYLDRRWDGVEECKPVEYQMPFVTNLDEHACKCHFFPDNAACAGDATEAPDTTAPDTSQAATTDNPTSTASVETTTAAAASSSAAPATTAAAPADCAAEWQQCGGQGTEDRCCAAGTQCYANSQWYSQCRTSCPAGWACNGRRNLRGVFRRTK